MPFERIPTIPTSEELLDKAFRRLKNISNKIYQVKKEMDNARISDYRYENSFPHY